MLHKTVTRVTVFCYLHLQHKRHTHTNIYNIIQFLFIRFSQLWLDCQEYKLLKQKEWEKRAKLLGKKTRTERANYKTERKPGERGANMGWGWNKCGQDSNWKADEQNKEAEKTDDGKE